MSSETNDNTFHLYNEENDKFKVYNDKLSEIETNINIVLDKLSKSYTNYKLYPDVSELENIYTNDMANLEDNENKLFLLEQEINKDNNDLVSTIDNQNNKLNQLKGKKNRLTNQNTSIVDTDAASIGFRYQIKDQYQQQYISFAILSSFTIFSLVSLYKNSTKSTK
jgi:hypothetical protein